MNGIPGHGRIQFLNDFKGKMMLRTGLGGKDLRHYSVVTFND